MKSVENRMGGDEGHLGPGITECVGTRKFKRQQLLCAGSLVSISSHSVYGPSGIIGDHRVKREVIKVFLLFKALKEPFNTEKHN